MQKIKKEFETKFHEIIISTYRKNFTPLLTESKSISDYVMMKRPGDNMGKVFATTDVGWGCTIRYN